MKKSFHKELAMMKEAGIYNRVMYVFLLTVDSPSSLNNNGHMRSRKKGLIAKLKRIIVIIF